MPQAPAPVIGMDFPTLAQSLMAACVAEMQAAQLWPMLAAGMLGATLGATLGAAALALARRRAR